MSEPRKTRLKEAVPPENPTLETDLQSARASPPDNPRSPEQRYLQRKAEVMRRDHEEFFQYHREKAQRTEAEQAHRPAADTAPPVPTRVNRRNFLPVVAGTAAVGE